MVGVAAIGWTWSCPWGRGGGSELGLMLARVEALEEGEVFANGRSAVGIGVERVEAHAVVSEAGLFELLRGEGPVLIGVGLPEKLLHATSVVWTRLSSRAAGCEKSGHECHGGCSASGSVHWRT